MQILLLLLVYQTKENNQRYKSCDLRQSNMCYDDVTLSIAHTKLILLSAHKYVVEVQSKLTGRPKLRK